MIWDKKFKVCLKPISYVCVGNGEEYQSYEYMNDKEENKIYLIDDDKVMELVEEGVITIEDVDAGPKELLKTIKKNNVLHRFQSAFIDDPNELVIKKFYKTLNVKENQEIEHIVAIPASTIKGLMRSGYDSYLIKRENKKIVYEYVRETEKKKNGKLKKIYELKGICNGKELIYNNKVFETSLLQTDVDQLFSKIKVNDLSTTNNTLIKKVFRYNRKKHKHEIPSYYEVVDEKAIFYGNIQTQTDENILTNTIKGLKELAEANIKVEKNLLKESAEDGFYEKLERENKKDYQAVVKIGFSGLMGKTFVSYDEKSNICYDDKFLPYTLLTTKGKYVEGKTRKQKPMGWAVLRIEEMKNKKALSI